MLGTCKPSSTFGHHELCQQDMSNLSTHRQSQLTTITPINLQLTHLHQCIVGEKSHSSCMPRVIIPFNIRHQQVRFSLRGIPLLCKRAFSSKSHYRHTNSQRSTPLAYNSPTNTHASSRNYTSNHACQGIFPLNI